MINVLFFGKLRDDFKIDQVKIESPCQTIDQLFDLLTKQHTQLSTLKDTHSLLIAINQDMADETTTLNPGDEVAFFPPVTGG
ncbi:MAG: molybdopterin converting factor subunit 1 [Saccharospirillaceae bacterium]|nr:molybdopterin converting factor subunit 1 [Pseudomonadales bacterium]NRB78769.1 molybdopterin converting factor subunit 1 [Saccharospirillaceae bacterium]